MELHRDAGNWMDEARYLVRQGETAPAQGQPEQCRNYLHTALRKAIQADAVAVQMDAMVQVARLWLQQQRTAGTMTILRSVADHPASSVSVRALAVQLLAAHNAPRLAPAAHEPALAPVAVLTALQPIFRSGEAVAPHLYCDPQCKFRGYVVYSVGATARSVVRPAR